MTSVQLPPHPSCDPVTNTVEGTSPKTKTTHNQQQVKPSLPKHHCPGRGPETTPLSWARRPLSCPSGDEARCPACNVSPCAWTQVRRPALEKLPGPQQPQGLPDSNRLCHQQRNLLCSESSPTGSSSVTTVPIQPGSAEQGSPRPPPVCSGSFWLWWVETSLPRAPHTSP